MHVVVVVQLLNRVQLFATPWTASCQASLSITISQSLLISCSLSWWCHPTISSSVTLFSSCLQSFPTTGSFQMSQVFPSGGQSIGASASASVLPIDFLYNWLVWSPCCPRDSPESSLASQFKIINSSVLNLPYGPTLRSIHNYWKVSNKLMKRLNIISH